MEEKTTVDADSEDADAIEIANTRIPIWNSPSADSLVLEKRLPSTLPSKTIARRTKTAPEKEWGAAI
eukprot:Pgem_evm1s15917